MTSRSIADGIVRRGLLLMDDGKQTLYSFSLRQALLYLQAEGITPQPDPWNPEHMRLGQTTFHPFESNDGAYVGACGGTRSCSISKVCGHLYDRLRLLHLFPARSPPQS